jgi:hypothetical protein
LHSVAALAAAAARCSKSREVAGRRLREGGWLIFRRASGSSTVTISSEKSTASSLSDFAPHFFSQAI